MSIERKPGKRITKLILSTVRAYLESKSHIIIERNDTVGLKPPYLILANHVNNWDPLFINCYVEEPICFVAGEPLFRNPFLKKLLNWTGAIPKTKFKNDISTIKDMMRAKKHGRVIGIFPEGNRTWDGVTEPIIYSTAKLIKSLHIPVVIVNIRGGYLTMPRWAERPRKGLITISFTKQWDADELLDLSIDSIYEKLTKALEHNEIEWQQQVMQPYEGRALAQYLERLLFLCPHCEQPGELRSEGDRFGCQHCEYSVRYTPYGMFESQHGPLYYATVHEWNRWQLEQLEQSLKEPAQHKRRWSHVMNDHVRLYVAEDAGRFQLVAEGQLSWATDRILFQSDEHADLYEFPFADLEGLNIHFHHKLDFYYEKKLYRFIFYQPRTSAYKWLSSIQYARQHRTL